MSDEAAPLCVRCGEASPIKDGDGLCSHCGWAIRAEIEAGLFAVNERLKKQVKFEAWLREHPDAL